MTTRLDTLNEALERLVDYRYLDGQGLACHAPMAAEAISSLGYDERVGAWVDTYVATHPPIDAPPAADTVDPDDEHSWRSALGDFSRVSDWTAMFDRQLRDRPWKTVLERWVPRFISGYGGGLTHGLLRTAHAVRALPTDGAPSDLMLGELAKGLASWAGWYRPLPGEPHLHGSLSLDTAIGRVPHPRDEWSAMEAGTFARMGELVDFPDVVEALGPPDNPERALSDLSARFCRVLLEHQEAMPIGLVHTVTPIAAVRTLIAHVPTISTDAVYARLWHVNAALIAGFTRPTPGGAVALWHDETPSPSDLGARAVEHPDPHVVKFTEACLQEHALRPDPVYLHAAANLLARIPTR
jgi:hypothetical protein